MKYPEHEKLAAVKDQSQAQGEFVEWLGEHGMFICTNDEANGFQKVGTTTRALLAEYHGINLDALEREKRQMLDDLRQDEEETN